MRLMWSAKMDKKSGLWHGIILAQLKLSALPYKVLHYINHSHVGLEFMLLC